MYKYLLTIIFSASFFCDVVAQDTLPRITVKKINKQIIISWKNNYGAKVSIINIQRSKDSLKNFVTIGSVLNPLNRENGYVDNNFSSAVMFYRVFVAFEGGTYLFSTAYRPSIDTLKILANIVNPTSSIVTELNIVDSIMSEPTINFPLLAAPEPIAEESFDHFLPKIKLPKIIVPTGFVASKYIFTNRENNLVLNLPDAEILKYSLKFYDDKDGQILEIKKITASYLLLEKVNFLHSGWFYYELFEDGLFLEKHQFYIGKEGKIGNAQIYRSNK